MLNEGMSPPVITVVVALVALNVVMCLFVVANPEAAATVFAGRGNWFTLALYSSVLAFGRYDTERDLAAGIPFSVLVVNCRRRAIRRLQLLLVGVVIVALVSVINGHMPRFTAHTSS